VALAQANVHRNLVEGVDGSCVCSVMCFGDELSATACMDWNQGPFNCVLGADIIYGGNFKRSSTQLTSS
jgi:hypothetical protein